MVDNPLMTALTEALEGLLPALPAPLRDKLTGELQTVKELLMEARPPKLLFVGRRGAGKSSLVNAIVGEPVAEVGAVLAQTATATWYTCHTARGELRLLGCQHDRFVSSRVQHLDHLFTAFFGQVVREESTAADDHSEGKLLFHMSLISFNC